MQYDRSGRICAVGPLQIDYAGSRPARARLQSNEALSDELLLVLFLVLFWQQQAWDANYQANR